VNKKSGKMINMVLSGGGIKGIAFSGAYDVAEQRGYRCSNVAGVSAGAIAGSFISAGCNSYNLKRIISDFDCSKMYIANPKMNLPVIMDFKEFCKQYRLSEEYSIESFLYNNDRGYLRIKYGSRCDKEEVLSRTLMHNIIKYSKNGCIFDGDYLEEWLYKNLSNLGIRTFKDLRGGIPDNTNPKGYKARFLAVDATRKKAISLPDDLSFYGINPDNFEVAKAVRMSASVPFIFKPIEFKKRQGKIVKTYTIVDGGVLDNFPVWMIGDSNYLPTLCFSLDGDQKKKLVSIDTSLKVLVKFISAVHNVGVPKTDDLKNKYLASINTSQVPSFAFDLSVDDKYYLLNEGKKSADAIFQRIELEAYRRNFF